MAYVEGILKSLIKIEEKIKALRTLPQKKPKACGIKFFDDFNEAMYAEFGEDTPEEYFKKEIDYIFDQLVHVSEFVCEKGGSAQWRGVHTVYGGEWTEALKEQIRERDARTCQGCGIHESLFTSRLNVHHINYNKADCADTNLISLCTDCHNKTTVGDRNEWEATCKEMLNGKKV